jgi:hypothetical protein
LKKVARELGKHKLDLVGEQEVIWKKSSTEQAEDYTFFYGKGNEGYPLGTGFLYTRFISAVRRVQFVSDRISCIILRGCWCHIILNVHAPCKDKNNDVKDSFYEELGHVFDQFSIYNIKILLDDFSVKVGRKPTVRNENPHEISNDNGIRVVNFATSKSLLVKSTMFSHHSIPGPLIKKRPITRSITF